MEFTPNDLIGPAAALVFAIIVVKVLWDAHKEADADMKAQRDIAQAIARDQVDATNRLADVLEEERRDRSMRRRLADERQEGEKK